MLETVLDKTRYGFLWLDLAMPERPALVELAEQYGLHPTSVEDCLEPGHLPKFEQFDTSTFMIVRAFDPAATNGASSVAQLTRKLAIFIGDGILITVHGRPLDFLDKLKKTWQTGDIQSQVPIAHALNDLLQSVMESYSEPLDNCEERLDRIERATFARETRNFEPRTSYVLLRRVSVIERMLRANVEVVSRCTRIPDVTKPFFQDLREQGDRLVLTANDVGESVQNVISISVSIADQRTNEVMRILTVFSVFFLPLNFLASLYGMNFERMPFLKSPHGFTSMVSIMILISVMTFFWFKRRRWF